MSVQLYLEKMDEDRPHHVSWDEDAGPMAWVGYGDLARHRIASSAPAGFRALAAEATAAAAELERRHRARGTVPPGGWTTPVSEQDDPTVSHLLVVACYAADDGPHAALIVDTRDPAVSTVIPAHVEEDDPLALAYAAAAYVLDSGTTVPGGAPVDMVEVWDGVSVGAPLLLITADELERSGVGEERP